MIRGTGWILFASVLTLFGCSGAQNEELNGDATNEQDLSTRCRTNADCNDNSPCTIDTCVANVRVCTHTIAAAGTVCRPAISACDQTEVCSGTSATCPPDSFAPAGVVCRASSSACDPAETCTGSSPTCPPDTGCP